MAGIRVYLNPDGSLRFADERGRAVRDPEAAQAGRCHTPPGYMQAVKELRALRLRYEEPTPGTAAIVPWAKCSTAHDEARARLCALALGFLHSRFGSAVAQGVSLQVRHPLGSFLAAAAEDIGALTLGWPCRGSMWANRITVSAHGEVRMIDSSCESPATAATAQVVAGFWSRVNDDVMHPCWRRPTNPPDD